MSNERRAFRPPVCSCGLTLTDKSAAVAGMKADIPMGYCPKCGTAQPLGDVVEAPKSKAKATTPPPEPEPEPAPAPEPEA